MPDSLKVPVNADVLPSAYHARYYLDQDGCDLAALRAERQPTNSDIDENRIELSYLRVQLLELQRQHNTVAIVLGIVVLGNLAVGILGWLR